MSIICGVLQSQLQVQTYLWGVPGCANHLWGPPITITGFKTHLWGCTRVCQSSVGSSNHNYRLKHICGMLQGVPIICGVLQLKLQAQTYLWGVPGYANHLWDPPIEITGSNTSVACNRVCQSSVGSSQLKLQAQTHLWHVTGCANHLWGPPIEVTGSNISVACTRVCQSAVGSSNWNYRLKHICEVYQGMPIICGILQSKLQAQNTSVACNRVCQSSVGSSN